MSGFRDTINADLHSVFFSMDEFAEKRTVQYDGVTYLDIPIILTGLKEQDRTQLVSDHAQGLYLVTDIMHVCLSDVGGRQPEKGCKICVNDAEGSSYFREFYIASSQLTMGKLRLELEAIAE